MAQSWQKLLVNVEMYEQVAAMFERGDLDRMLRLAKVRREDWEDFRSYVLLRLLTHKGKVQDWKAYAYGFIRREYHSRRSGWWKEQGRWNAERVGLQDARGEVPALGGFGDLGGEGAQGAEDVPGAFEIDSP